jgi:hypothetical protein
MRYGCDIKNGLILSRFINVATSWTVEAVVPGRCCGSHPSGRAGMLKLRGYEPRQVAH